ncbi:hypothetical protein K439DRAFT_1630576 [Ramaria rubella]|nr:hypothetical protein K439DRAFT_1630576 [Ramaria rubella]
MQPELVMNQPAPRKQNIACDACRSRKVKCVMIPGQEQCQHCQIKSYPCTFNVQRETSEKKRQGSLRRRNSESTTGAIQNSSTFSPLSNSASPTPVSQPSNYAAAETSSPTPLTAFYSNGFSLSSRTQPLNRDSSAPPPPGPPFITPTLPPSPSHQAYPETSTTRLLAYLFSPESSASLFPEFTKGYRALPDYQQRQQLRLDDWGEVGLKLQDPAFRIEFALDLVEVYFEICHTRIALLVPARFRAQLRASLNPLASPATTHLSLSSPSTSNLPPVHPAVLATVLAWGAKFSEHPLIVLDRTADISGTRRSRLAKSLIRKAREIAETEMVHTVPSPDGVIVCILLDGLHSHHVNDPDGYRGFWINSALRHLLHYEINNRSAVPVLVEPERRNTMVYAWWIACLGDAFGALYFRRKPMLEDADYNIDFPEDMARIAQSESESGSEHVAKRPEFLAWYAASHEMARCAREMSRQLWRPVVYTEGIPLDVLCALMRELNVWRADNLDKVGVPGPGSQISQSNWDFLAAVSACGHDATYHVMWIILYQALREFGLREMNEMKRTVNGVANHHPHLASQFSATEAQVQKEALNAASRIAGLSNLLESNSYLRLDPNVMHFSIYAAGRLLAEFGQEEVAMCIRGLQQYGISYADAFDQADEIQRMYASSSRVDPEPPAQVWDGVTNTAESHHSTYSLPAEGASSYVRTSNPHHSAPMPQR